MTRVLALWLDGFDIALADRWGLPHLHDLTARSAVAELDNGTAHLTGLSGEHLSTGLDPVAAGRASAVRFDPHTYAVHQEGALRPPVLGGVPTVVFDPCYFDLDRARPEVRGVTDWGAHDPGGPGRARPAGLHDEVVARFGAYPARPWLYATPWASPDACRAMGADLTTAVERRADIAEWLLAERMPAWSLALVGVSEAHSASEGLFHGASPAHPLHREPSGPAAAEGLRSVYSAIDTLVGRLQARFPDAVTVTFTMHGMGPNRSDVASMALLGELVARWAGRPTPDAAFPLDPVGVPRLAAGASWTAAVLAALDPASVVEPVAPPVGPARRVARRLPEPVKVRLRGLRRPAPAPAAGPDELAWMPLTRHRASWPHMDAFAVPSFYDGRIRVNLEGREAQGRVPLARYGEVLDELEAVLAACREPRHGGPVVTGTARPAADPLTLDPTDADLVVQWADDVLGLAHPTLGTIGPLPPRRTGGHTSPRGRCLVTGPGIEPRHLGGASSFDVLPTLLALAGVTPHEALSGRPLLHPQASEPV